MGGNRQSARAHSAEAASMGGKGAIAREARSQTPSSLKEKEALNVTGVTSKVGLGASASERDRALSRDKSAIAS